MFKFKKLDLFIGLSCKDTKFLLRKTNYCLTLLQRTQKMRITETNIKGVFIINPDIHEDQRGYFMESYSERDFRTIIGDIRFVQDNESKSSYGVVRGLHFQKPPHSQSKLVRVIEGSVMDIAVDLRADSPTYGQYVAEILTGDNHKQMFVPQGFAHGFVVLSETAIFQYKCDNFYAPESEGAIAWNDPDINIDWKIPIEDMILSDKDKNHPYLKDIPNYF